MTGYHDLVLTVNGSPILSGRTFKLDSTTTVESSATINTYTIAYNANGGTGTMSSQGMTYDQASTLTANAFTRVGYTFSHWNTKQDNSGTTYANKASVSNLTTTNNGTVTLYAQWTPITYTIAFNKNAEDATGTTANVSIKYDETKSLTTNGFTRAGYTFSGWNTEANGSGTSYTNGQSVTNLTSTAGTTITLYAQWTGIQYTVRFNSNGGTGSMADQTMTYGTPSNLTSNAFTKAGYSFVNWNTAANGSGTSYANGAAVSTLTTTAGGVVTLYAQWSSRAITVAINKDGSAWSSSGINVALYQGDTLKYAYSTAEKNGATVTFKDIDAGTYDIRATKTNNTNADVTVLIDTGIDVTVTTVASTELNYYTIRKVVGTGTSLVTKLNNASGADFNTGKQVYAGTTVYASASALTGYNTPTLKVNNGSATANTSFTINQETTFTSAATENTYKIAFDKNASDATGTMATVTGVKYTENKVLPGNEFVRPGYVFEGWARTAGGAKEYNDEATVNGLTSTNNATVTLYAKWTANNYTIKFNKNASDATGTMADLAMVYSASKNLTTNGFSRAGYTFANWNTESDGSGTSYNNGASVNNLTTEVNGIVNLYAQWTYSATPTITLEDYNTFSYSATAGAAYFVSTSQSTKPSATATGWTTATITADLTLVEGTTYYVWVKDAEGNVSANSATIAVRTITKSVGAGSTLTAKQVNSSGADMLFTSNKTTVLNGSPVYFKANAISGYNTPVLKINNASQTNATYTGNVTADITVASSASIITYTITYTSTVGTASTANPTTYNVTTPTFTLINPTKDGYTFAGWTGTGLSSASESVSINQGSTGNRNYTENWTYSATPSIELVDYNTFNYSATAGASFLVSTTQSSKPAANASGWTTSTTTGDLSLAEGTTYYVWVKDSAGNVSANSATIAVRTITRSVGTGSTLTANHVNSSGTAVSFNGSNKAFVLNGATVYLKANASTGYNSPVLKIDGTAQTNATYTGTVTSNISVATSASIVTYTITYASNVGTASSVGNPTSYNVTTATFTLTNPTKAGYTFNGWTGSNGTTAQTTVTIAKGSTGNKNYTENWTYSATPAISLSDYNTFTYSATAGAAFYVSTSSTAPTASSNQTTFALNKWTTATNTGDLTLAEGQTYYVWAKDANGNISANKATIVVRTITRSVGTGSTLTANHVSSSGTAISFSSNKAYVLNGSTVYFKANASAGYNNPVLKIGNTEQANATYTGTITKDITVSTSASIVTYTITYTPNGGTVSPANPTSYNVTTPTFTIKDLTKAGYTFNGWTGSNGSTPQKNIQITQGSTGNKSYTANWTYSATPTITLVDYNTFNYSATAGASYFVSTSQSTKPSATATGWTTATTTGDLTLTEGTTYYVWVKDSDGNVSANSATIIVRTITQSIGAGSSLTAKHGSSSGANMTFSSNKVNVLNGATVYFKANANTGYNTPVLKIDNVAQTDATYTGTVTKNITVATSATPTVYTITLNNQDATTAGTTAIYEKYATGYYTNSTATSQMTTSANGITVPVRTGYTFEGYYTTAEGGDQYISKTGFITSTANNTHFTSNGTLYAHWSKTMSSLTNSVSPTTYVYDGNAKKPTPTSKDGSTTLTKDTDYSVAYSSNTNVGLSTAVVTFTGKNVYNGTTKAFYTGTATVNFTITNAKITFNASSNSGLVSGTSPLYVKKGSTGIYTGATNTTAGTIPTATRTGYDFSGWWTAASGGSKVINADKSVVASVSGWTDGSKNWQITADSTLYAQFTPHVYTITLNNQSATTAGSSAIYEKYATGYYKDSAATTQMTTSANGITVPARSGYTFNGYYTTEAGGDQYISNTGFITSTADNTHFTSNGNLHAHWSKPMGSLTSSLTGTEFIYTGSAISPTETVKDGNTTLTKNTDYTIAYSNNTSVGTATATLTGKNAYNGTTKAFYTG
jgi:uncharacterized repeat protein (TIGR02543 family)